MLLCCITLSSSRENQRSAQEVARRISGAVAEESTQNSTYQVPLNVVRAMHDDVMEYVLKYSTTTILVGGTY